MARRRSGLLPFTLTEVLALLFFALALALVREASQRAEAEERAAKNQALEAAFGPLGPEGAAALVSVLTQGGRSVPEDFDELVRDARMAVEARETLERLAEETGDAALGEPQDITERIEQLLDSNRNLRGQLANLQRRAGSGLDHPPCWADERGRPEYAFRITLRDGTVDVEPIWPPHREDDARRTPGMTAAPGTVLTLADFERRAAPIFAWSRRQDPECRHMVRVVDRVPADEKDVFIDELLAVERYFYKYLVR